jgi:hypothetical protein
MSTKNSSPLILVVFGGILLAGGLALFYFIGKPTLDEAIASKTWPKVKGVITISRVDSRVKKGKTTYSSHVEYEYSLNDQETFYGHRIWIGQYSSNNQSEHKKNVAKYPSGAQVDVYYNPKSPESSVLEPGAVYSSYIAFGIGLGIAAIGGLLLIAPVISFFLYLVNSAFSTKDSTAGNYDQAINDNSNDRNDADDVYTVEDERFKNQNRD